MFTTTTSWVRHEITFPADTTGAFNNDIERSLDLSFWIHAGSTYAGGTLNTTAFASTTTANRAAGIDSFFSSTDNEFFLTGVQLEVGSQATPFEHRSFGEELALCQRYYQIVGISFYDDVVSGRNYGANTGFPTQMRATPTVESSATTSNNNRFNSNAVNAGVQATVTSMLAHKTSILTSDAGYYLATMNLKSEL